MLGYVKATGTPKNGRDELGSFGRFAKRGGDGPTEFDHGGSGYAGQVHDGEHPGSGTASWDGAWCSFEHGGVSTLEQSHRLALHAP